MTHHHRKNDPPKKQITVKKSQNWNTPAMLLRTHLLSKRYTNITDRETMKLETIFKEYPFLSIEEKLSAIKDLIKPLSPVKEESTRVSYKTNLVTGMLGTFKPKTILDLGGGSGEVLKSIVTDMNISKENAYILDVIEAKEKNDYTPLTYQEENVIPLPDKSIDLVILAHVLHHIHPEDRQLLLKEVNRILSNKGRVIIQEHDDNKSTKFYQEVDLYHIYWSAVTGDPVDPLYMETRETMKMIFVKEGLYPKITIEPSGWQRMYWTMFTRTEETSLTVPSSSFKLLQYRMTEEYQSLEMIKEKARGTKHKIEDYLKLTDFKIPYHSRVKFNRGTKIPLKIGQLKLLTHHIWMIVTHWDPIKTPNLILVYAGAAPGQNFQILSEMFKGITFQLYDPAKFVVKASNRIILYTGEKNGYFTDQTAMKWSGKDNVIFLSDIRPRDYDRDDENTRGKVVDENMRQQQKWVEIMKPLAASLKFRLPYTEETNEETYTYLEGDIIQQSYGPYGAETRLIVKGDNLGYTEYDIKDYEDEMFAFQTVIREEYLFSNPLVDSEEYVEVKDNDTKNTLDNSFDSASYLYVIKLYSDFIRKYPEIGIIKGLVFKFAKSLITRLFGMYSKEKNFSIVREELLKEKFS